MNEREMRLGDSIDDHCPRCRHLLEHAVASMMNGQVVKVICQTCHTEHAYHHGEGGKKKTGPRSTLFDQVLSKVAPSEAQEERGVSNPKKNSEAAAGPVSKHKARTPRGKSK